MPRRGEHHAVRAARPDTVPVAESGALAEPGARIGARVVQSRRRSPARCWRRSWPMSGSGTHA